MSGETRSAINPWWMLFTVTLSQVAVALGNQAVYPITPLIKESLNLTPVQVGYFAAVTYSGGIGILWISGWITDKFGAKIVLIVAQLLVGISMLGAAAAPSFVTMLFPLCLAGLGYGMVTPAGTKAVHTWFATGRQGIAMGLKQTGVTIGGALAAYLLPVIASVCNPVNSGRVSGVKPTGQSGAIQTPQIIRFTISEIRGS